MDMPSTSTMAGWVLPSTMSRVEPSGVEAARWGATVASNRSCVMLSTCCSPTGVIAKSGRSGASSPEWEMVSSPPFSPQASARTLMPV